MFLGFVVAAISFAAASALPASEVAARAPAAINLIEICVDINFGNCEFLTATTIPTGCLFITSVFPNDAASSAKPVGGIICTLWNNSDCTGNSLTVTGNVPDFTAVNFNDEASGISCVSN